MRRALAAITCFLVGVAISPRYDIASLDVPYVLKPRCGIFRVGRVLKISDDELRRQFPDLPPSKSGTWTVVRDWGFDCTDTLGQDAVIEADGKSMKAGGYAIEELEAISNLYYYGTLLPVKEVQLPDSPRWITLKNGEVTITR